MRATKGYVAGLGTTSALVAAIACAFAVVSAVVAVQGWTGTLASPGVQTLDAGEAARPSGSLEGLFGAGADSARVRDRQVGGRALRASGRAGAPANTTPAGESLAGLRISDGAPHAAPGTNGQDPVAPGATAAERAAGSSPGPAPASAAPPRAPGAPGGGERPAPTEPPASPQAPGAAGGSGAGGTVGELTSGVGEAVGRTGQQLGGVVQGATGQLGGTVGQVSPAAGQVVTQTGQAAAGAVSGATGAVGQVVQGAGGAVGGLLGGLGGGGRAAR